MIGSTKLKYFIFWDIGNVFIKFCECGFYNALRAKKRMDFSDIEFRKRYNEIIGMSFLGKITLVETWEYLFKLADVNETEAYQIRQKYKVIINRDLVLFVKTLSDNHGIGFISDLHQIAYQEVCDKCQGILDISPETLIYLSNQTGKSKFVHGKKYLESIFKSAKAVCKNIIFIDDDIENIRIAKFFRVQALIFPQLRGNQPWQSANQKLISQLSNILNLQS